MINPIPESIKKIWDKWNIRGLMLFSLSLQIILILFAPRRKSSRSKLVMFFIWSAYLFADWAANFGVGLIADHARDTSANNELLAFWAPFMLLHLGGPDSITAFSLADNELWLRHLLALIFQAVGTVYVFLLTLPGNKLSIPTVIVFIAGTIKYSERIRALYLASVERFRASTLGGGAELGDIEHLALRIDGDWDWNFWIASEHFERFKAIFVDLSVGALKSYYLFGPEFVGFSPEVALRIFEIELSLAYQVFYTKIQVIQSVSGIILRFICFGSVVIALSVFYFQVEKNGFSEFDVRVTYTLLLGATALEIIAFFMLGFSDSTFVALSNYYDESRLGIGKQKKGIAAILRPFLFLKSSRWESCHSHSEHNVLATHLLFRRWSGSVSGFSWIRYCHKESPSREHKIKSSCLHLKIIDQFILWMAKAINGCINTTVKLIQVLHIYKIIKFLQINKLLDMLARTDMVDWIRVEASLSQEPLTEEFWGFLFNEIQSKQGKSGDLAADWRIFFQSRDTGDAIEEFSKSFPTEEEVDPKSSLSSEKGPFRPLISFIKSFPREDDRFSFVDSLVIWHLTTEYLYKKTAEVAPSIAREASKILSDYMMYLFVSKVAMINFSESISKKIREDLLKDNDNGWLINPRSGSLECLLERIKEQSQNSNDSKSRFAQGAIELVVMIENLRVEDQELEVKYNMWDLISKVWVELLSNGSIHCSGKAHLQQLSNGGELLTFVWLLLHYFNNVKFSKLK